MTGFSLEEFDRHIDHLRAQLQYLSEGLDATDHNAPDWLATDLISLRNKSGRLQDDMKRFRDQLQNEGLAVKKSKTANKRLSIESAKPSTPSRHTIPTNHAASPPTDMSPTPRARAAQPDNGYVTEHIDVTEEVNRRMQESRLRRLMETPSTAQKRKRNALEENRSESAGDAGFDDASRNGFNSSERDGTPTKRLKSSGTFEQVLKRKEDGDPAGAGEERFPDRTGFKRRRI